MKPTRRWFQYSLRSFLVVLTALPVWLGVVVNRAHEQREAVKAIEAMGGIVFYDWQERGGHNSPQFIFPEDPPDMPFRHVIGDDFFQKPVMVSFATYPVPTESDVLNAIPHLARMPGLKYVQMPTRASRRWASTRFKLGVPRG